MTQKHKDTSKVVRFTRLFVLKIWCGLGAIVAARGCDRKNKQKRGALWDPRYEKRATFFGNQNCRGLTAFVPEWCWTRKTQKRQALCFRMRGLKNWFSLRNLFTVNRIGGESLPQNAKAQKVCQLIGFTKLQIRNFVGFQHLLRVDHDWCRRRYYENM